MLTLPTGHYAELAQNVKHNFSINDSFHIVCSNSTSFMHIKAHYSLSSSHTLLSNFFAIKINFFLCSLEFPFLYFLISLCLSSRFALIASQTGLITLSFMYAIISIVRLVFICFRFIASFAFHSFIFFSILLPLFPHWPQHMPMKPKALDRPLKFGSQISASSILN